MLKLNLLPHDRMRLACWLAALVSAAVTAAIYRWRPDWVADMRIVIDSMAVALLAWLLATRFIERRGRRRRR